jgi:pyruvate dehydrogenase E1 component beta subunit
MAPLDLIHEHDPSGFLNRPQDRLQATRHASVTAMIAADIAEHRFGALKAPIVQVTAADTTIPYSEPLETHVVPDETRIAAAARRVLD